MEMPPKQPTQPRRLVVTLKLLVDIKKKNASYRHAQKMKAFNLHIRNRMKKYIKKSEMTQEKKKKEIIENDKKNKSNE